MSWALGKMCAFDLETTGASVEDDRIVTGCVALVDASTGHTDIRTLDKIVDRYRKGSRKLADACTHYGVRIDGAHDASHDALAAARILYKIASGSPGLAAMPLPDLHQMQVRAKAEQAASFRAYLKRQGDPADGVRGEWPIIPASTEETPR